MSAITSAFDLDFLFIILLGILFYFNIKNQKRLFDNIETQRKLLVEISVSP